MSLPGVPEYAVPFFWPSLLGTGTHLSRGNDAPAVSVRQGDAPQSKTARPLNSRPSGRDDIAARVLDAGEGA
jgi:hypothetical protein